jgi:hypothetical protein
MLALLLNAISVSAAGKCTFRANLTGDNEVPARATMAFGKASFKLNEDGSEIHYRIVVNKISSIFMGHIHLAASGVNGPIVVWLYPEVALPTPITTSPPFWSMGEFSGTLYTGTIVETHLTGLLAGITLSNLVAEIRAGNTYVNIHTNDFMGDPNTGPGDFPGGEIRGQIN